MAVYFRNQKVLINMNSRKYKLKSPQKNLNHIILMTSNDQVLKESNGLYITTQEDNK